MTHCPADDTTDDAALRRALLAWYRAHARSLPWRDDPTPYRVWLSEIMLQQTQVDTVRPYFERWLERFPTLQALAEAPTDDLLAAWSGLGYYRRAHNMQKCAQAVVQQHGGQLPADHAALLALPGIGRYTAGAIASIAFGLPHPVVDGNVARVFARLFALEGEPSTPAMQRTLWAIAERLLDRDAPGDFNQALMELGSQVCRPRNPACADCPLQLHCAAFASGRQSELPTPKRRAARHREIAAALLVRLEPAAASAPPRYLVARRSADLLEGLWSLPTVTLARAEGRERTPELDRELAATVSLGSTMRQRIAELAAQVLGERAPEADALRPLRPVEHGFTHLEYTLVPWLCSIRVADDVPTLEVALDPAVFSAWRLVTRQELTELGVPRMIARVFAQL